MPMYQWLDSVSRKNADTIRHFEQYEEPPTREEATALTDEEYAAAQWERVIHVPGVVKGYNWGGKGHW